MRDFSSRLSNGPHANSAVPGLGALPNFPPEPERHRKVTILQRDHGPHDQGLVGPVELARAACEGFRPNSATALELLERPPPVAGRGSLDGQHLTQIGLASAADWALHVSGPARRAALHQGYSR